MQSDDLVTGLEAAVRLAIAQYLMAYGPDMKPSEAAEIVGSRLAAAAIERLVAERDAALLSNRVCAARIETLTTCGLSEVAMSNATVMRQWGDLTAERDEAREACAEALKQIEAAEGLMPEVEAIEAQRDKLKMALRQIADLDEVESALDPEWTINRARQALKDAP